MKPAAVHYVDGSEEEDQLMKDTLVKAGTFTKLNEKLRPNSYLARSDPADVARSEAATIICTTNKEDAGPTNNWKSPEEMKAILAPILEGCMEGRTMYVIAFSMGPVGSPLARYGVQITDSAYVVVNMRIMAVMGKKVVDYLDAHPDQPWVQCVHTVAYPLKEGVKDVTWPCNIPNRWITHFPETLEIISTGSGYGGNALLGKKCLALRIASNMARKDGDALAEHMLVMGLTSPAGSKHYIAAAFPSACGKTNLAMLRPTLPGWKVETIGDDIAWLKFGPDGRLYAINPEAGFFGVAPGTSDDTNYNAMRCLDANCVYTNVALTEDGDVWWEGMTPEPPAGKITTWRGQIWSKDSGEPKPDLAHPNSRFTAPSNQCPILDPAYYNLAGVPIDAIVFGGRRQTKTPLVFQAYDWDHGVMIGSSVSSEMTAAAEGGKGQLRFDPFAMLPFCGYNMGDYWNYWLSIGKKTEAAKLPKIFHVNWFRKKGGKFLWPGFGENSRVLKWIVERCEDKAAAIETPIGYTPAPEALDLSGLKMDEADLKEVLSVDPVGYLDEVAQIREYYAKMGERLPKGVVAQLDALEQRLKAAQKA
ncbi:phosphoenolpyruvate carboxykinase [GTP] [Hyaloraphidium curvatum]|nr:phosphoenolpyruvate carboxykinase [GTP] [Hyaloraphidium curvatum]